MLTFFPDFISQGSSLQPSSGNLRQGGLRKPGKLRFLLRIHLGVPQDPRALNPSGWHSCHLILPFPIGGLRNHQSLFCVRKLVSVWKLLWGLGVHRSLLTVSRLSL